MRKIRLAVVAVVLGAAAAVGVANGGPAAAEVLWSWGEQGTAADGSTAPVASGCYARFPTTYDTDTGEEFVGTWVTQNYSAVSTLEGCSGYNWTAQGYDGARWNGTGTPATTAPATTTTTVPATTTTTAAPITCWGPEPFCRDQVGGPGTRVDVQACGSGAEAWCSPEWLQNPQSETYYFAASTSAAYWRLRRTASGEVRAQFSRAPAGQPGGSTGEMCLLRGTGNYALLGFSAPVGAEGTAGTVVPSDVRFMFRLTLPLSKHQMRSPPGPGQAFYSDSEAERVCRADDAAAEPVEPGADCYREFLPGNKVRMRQRVRGAAPVGAVDVSRLRVPWEATDRTGLVADFDLPPEGVAMPAAGWRGVCTLERTLAESVSSSAWQTAPGNEMKWDVPPGDVVKSPEPTQSFAGPASAPTGIISGNGATYTAIRWLSTVGSGAVTATASTAAAVGAAAVTGWTLGGAVVAGAANWTGDDPWFCQFNPGYRLARDGYCTEVMEQKELQRSQVAFQDANGQWLTTTTVQPWRKATVVTEVVINPLRPNVGGRNTTDVVKPKLTTGQSARLDTVLSNPEGSTRAEQQTTNPTGTNGAPPTISADPRPPDAPTTPTPDGDSDASGCWTWNPLSWFKGLACFARWLLLPNGETVRAAGRLWDNLSGKTPFTFLAVIQWPGNQVEAAHNAAKVRSILASSSDCFFWQRVQASGGMTSGAAGVPVLCATRTTFAGANIGRDVLKWTLYLGFGIGVFMLARRTIEH